MELAGWELRTATRAHQFATVLLLDLNDMKLVNDSLAHDTGDRLLITAAQVSRLLQKFGGDAFAVLAMGSGLAEAGALRLRLLHHRTEFNADLDAPFRLSFSIGIGIFNPTTGGEFDTLLETADRDMYQDRCRLKASLGAGRDERARRPA
jgi:diguanylate cyclase (GGDEF)-like protein